MDPAGDNGGRAEGGGAAPARDPGVAGEGAGVMGLLRCVACGTDWVAGRWEMCSVHDGRCMCARRDGRGRKNDEKGHQVDSA